MDLKAIIVDDEEDSRIVLFNMLSNFCEGVEVIGQAENVAEAVKLINQHQPNVVFLDIEMPEQNGFKLFDYFDEPTFEVIFTTAYNQYAVEALRLSAVDYLLKPIDLEQLRDAISRLNAQEDNQQNVERITTLKENIATPLSKIALPTNDGFVFVKIEDIVRCEASGNYTTFFLITKEKIIVTKTLGVFEKKLDGLTFFRSSRSDLINMKHLERYIRHKNPTIIMADGSNVSLSESRRSDFIKMIESGKSGMV